MTADPEAVARALAAEIPRHSAGMGSKPGTLGTDRDDGGLRCSCGEWKHGPGKDGLRPWPEFWMHLASVLASLLDDRLAEAEKDANGPGWFWTRTEWSEWSNELALLIPEEYDDDVAQEAVISRAVADMVKRLAEAEAKVQRVEAVLDEADQRHEDAEMTTVPLVSVIAVRTALLRVQNGAALSGQAGDTGPGDAT